MIGHIVVGTAGHVDHGKTLLTAALTGVDTDRLPEEKRRGMTIVPGYVRLDLSDGTHLGLVDVPGHEKFIKNMLAGVGGIDMALLVVAADEGVMPQTIEHTNILNLLGIKKVVIAVTKCDMIGDDSEWLEMVHEQIAQLIADTAFHDAEIVDVSAVTGFNISLLIEALGRATAQLKERPHVGMARMPVDRVFTKQGFGTVVTGTLWAGSLSVGQILELMPQRIELRVRGLQVHGEPVQKVYAGQRSAINLAGPDTNSIKIGCWIAEPGLLSPSYRIDVSFDLLKGAPELKHRSRVHVFHGTKEVSGRVRLLDRASLKPGETCFCQLELEVALMVLRGDRIIVRNWSPEATIAGATVLDPDPPRYRLSSENTMSAISRKAGRNDAQILLDTLDTEQRAMSLKSLMKTAKLSEQSARDAASKLEQSKLIIRLGKEDIFVSAELYERQSEALKQSLSFYHKEYPLRAGTPDAELRQKIFGKMEGKYVNLLLDLMETEGFIERSEGMIAASGFVPEPTFRQSEQIDRIVATYLKKLFVPPVWPELMRGFRISEAIGQEYLIYLLSKGTLLRLDNDYFHCSAPDEAARRLRDSFPEGFTVAQARDIMETTRRFAMPVLSELDRRGVTRRDGDIRTFV